MTTKHSHRITAAIGILLVLPALSACAGLPVTSVQGAVATEQVPADTTPRGPIEVAGESVVQQGSSLDSLCFSVEIPRALEGYSLEPGSEACSVWINFPGGDGYTRITVQADTGLVPINELKDVLDLVNEQSEFGGTTGWTEFGGQQFLQWEEGDDSGLNRTHLMVDAPVGVYAYEGMPITNFEVYGFAGIEGYRDAMEAIAASLMLNP